MERVCDTQGFLVGVSDCSHADGQKHRFENGMSIFYLLGDGTFLLYDGGQGREDAEHLYGLLCDTARRNGLDKIVISAWVITHEHGDHMGFAKYFLPRYQGDLEIRELWLHALFPWGKDLIELFKETFPACRLRQLTVGERFSLADVEVEVLCTPEALEAADPGAIQEDGNNASLVTRLTVRGKTVLMSGDAALRAWAFLTARYGTALKSDYLQVPHHGANHGATKEAYDLVGADVLLFPCGEELYRTIITEGSRYYCSPDCRHNLFNPQTFALVQGFEGKQYVAGAYVGENPVCQKFIG